MAELAMPHKTVSPKLITGCYLSGSSGLIKMKHSDPYL